METARTFIARAQGQEVVVVLRDRSLRGRLEGADEFLNLHLEEAEETRGKGTRKLGRLVVRGSQVIAIHAAKLGPPVAESAQQPYADRPRFEERGGYGGRGYEGGPPGPRWQRP